MARNSTASRTTLSGVTCSICEAKLEPVGNRLFMMYKRANLPQPRPEAWVCMQCGWVEGDARFQALLEERIARQSKNY